MSSVRREPDEELLLFKELFRRDKEENVSLLRLVPDDFDASPGFYRLSSGRRGDGYDPFALDGEKNDFNWLKTPPPTPLFPSLEMESIDSKFPSYKEPLCIKPTRTSRFAKIQEGPKPIQRPKSPSASSTTSSSHSTSSSRSATPNRRLGSAAATTTTTTLGDALNIKRRPKQTRFTTSNPSTTTTTVAALSDTKPHTRVVTGEAAAASARQNLVLGSRMVEKMMNARRSAAAAPESELMTRSSLGLAFRHMELRKGGSEQQQKNSVSSKPITEAASGDGERVGFRRRSIDKNGGVRSWFENLVN